MVLIINLGFAVVCNRYQNYEYDIRSLLWCIDYFSWIQSNHRWTVALMGVATLPYFFTLTFNSMIEKIIVWGNGEPKTIEQVSYNEYNIIEPYLVKEGE